MTGANCEYVADITDTAIPGTYDITDHDTAEKEIINYLTRRISTVLKNHPSPHVIMLSGGIDSILVATIAASLTDDLRAVTVAHPGNDDAQQELSIARDVSHALGIEHDTITLGTEQWLEIVTDTVTRLNSSDPWEVIAGASLRAVDIHAQEHSLPGALLTGGGADVLFMGGSSVPPKLPEWDNALRGQVSSSFTRDRFIPDFYERLLDEPTRHILVWQTLEAYRLALRIHPTAVRGRRNEDKGVHRDAARSLGIPDRLVGEKKGAMQFSSGGVDSLVAQARADLSDEVTGFTYSDPVEESPDFLVARYWLRDVHRRLS